MLDQCFLSSQDGLINTETICIYKQWSDGVDYFCCLVGVPVGLGLMDSSEPRWWEEENGGQSSPGLMSVLPSPT